ncbi:helix-turn-helix transcriptional regulator [Escherichia coli]|nr:helix-turn-helix transcriptional regulator [Escherichia coli]
MSLYSYLLRRRMTFAATLLRLTSISVTEIAYILHYSSHQNFCRAFKKYTFRTPNEYRKEEVWDFSIMQWTFILSNEKEITCSLNKIKEKYFSGEEFIVVDNLNQYGGESLSNDIKEIVSDFWDKYKSDVIVLFDMKDKLIRSLINIENYNESDVYIKMKVGVLKDHCSKGDMIIPEGDYLNYFFTGSWNDYLRYSRPLYVKIMSELNAKLKKGPVYVRFLYTMKKHKNNNDHVECEIYSPINN